MASIADGTLDLSAIVAAKASIDKDRKKKKDDSSDYSDSGTGMQLSLLEASDGGRDNDGSALQLVDDSQDGTSNKPIDND